MAERLEPLDARIASELARDGRCSYTDLAERVGLSVSAVHQRVRRLEQRGVIRGYAAMLDGEQVGLPLTALISLMPIGHWLTACCLKLYLLQASCLPWRV